MTGDVTTGSAQKLLSELRETAQSRRPLDQLTGIALKRPGSSRRQTELVKQANKQIRLRGEKLRSFKDCVNQAIRQAGPQSDQFAPTGTGTPHGDVQTQPTRQRSPAPDNGGDKGIKRLPEKPATPRGKSQPTMLEKKADDCSATSVSNYPGPDWARYNGGAPRPQRGKPVQQPFDIVGIAADQALDPDEAIYDAREDRELMRDYLVGWLMHCATDRKVLPKQNPRIPYRRLMEARELSDSKNTKRITRRFQEFRYGYRSYPLPPFWDHDVAGPPSPAQ